ncbi:MAG: hypothetical protein JWQ71_3007 [Pedosphaera sp.]|nr:hypothetical protein [Pedosphaera sp.]
MSKVNAKKTENTSAASASSKFNTKVTPDQGFEDWIQTLRGCSTDQVTNIIKRAALKGKWAEFKKSKDSSYTPRKIEMLMRIASNAVLSDAQHFAHFPEAWTTLHALSAIAEPKLVELIEAERITPQLTLPPPHIFTQLLSAKSRQGQ